MIPPPNLDLGSGVLKRQEPMAVQTFVPQAAVERYQKSIVRRLARPTEVERHAVLVHPAVKRLRDELKSVVYPDALGRSSRHSDPCHRLDHLLALDPLDRH